MAEQQTPTFKLVLVGDGGTGKVRRDCLPPSLAVSLSTARRTATPPPPASAAQLATSDLTLPC